MQLIVYRLVYPLLWTISKLPWPLFYAFSTGIYLLLYYCIGYRKKTVLENLTLVFPEKSSGEIKKIRKYFYKHMCDMFLEMIKSISISNDEMKKRFRVTNLDKFHKLEDKGGNIMILMAHYASYEWANVIDIQTGFQAVGIYKPIGNKYFDRLVLRIRARFGSRVITTKETMEEITKDQTRDGLFLYGIAADQSPKINKAMYWTDFMGIKVPAFIGAAVLSSRLGLSTYYLRVEKVKRGYYEATLETITEEAQNKDPNWIVKEYLKQIENQIRKNPQYYLWSHKRWKHRNATIPEGATVD
ncbi:lysophospholipid acyltransferase family protein [Aquimarina pacifica]|uniref:lysophospholipid acyltransferase family protein n=1 Tax=Aquimarina pacifica TaxID=1296415 RepID=UPI000471A4A5|nr:lysophospholipid acyltransferase family protein [Aquimarina pacifica]